MSVVLSGPELGLFADAIQQSVTSLGELDRFLTYKLDRRLADISKDSDLPDAIFQVVTKAKAGNWLPDLIHAARRHFTDTDRFDTFADLVPEPGIRTTGRDLLTQFDLEPIEDAFRTARMQCEDDSLIAVAVVSSADLFERCLVERLVSVVGQGIYKRYSLSAAVFTVPRVMESLARVKPSVAKCSAIIHVSVGTDDGGALVDPFWTAFRDEFGSASKQVVLLLTMPCPLDLPPDVKQLPVPTWDEGVIDRWLSGIARREKWSGPQQRCVFRQIWKRVQDVAEDARAPILYDELQNILNDIQSDPINLNGRFTAA